MPGDDMNSPIALYRFETMTSKMMKKNSVVMNKSPFAKKDRSVTIESQSNQNMVAQADDPYFEGHSIHSQSPRDASKRLPRSLAQAQSQSVNNSTEKFDWLNSSATPFDKRRVSG